MIKLHSYICKSYCNVQRISPVHCIMILNVNS